MNARDPSPQIPSLRAASGQAERAALHAQKHLPLFALARQNHAAGHWDEADILYRLILTLAPGHIEALHALASLEFHRTHYTAAADLYRQALVYSPDNAQIHINLADALSADGKLDEAIDCYRHVTTLRPDSVEAFRRLGARLHTAQRHEEAREVWEEVCARFPDDLESLCGLGLTLVALEQPDLAIETYRRALDIDPNHIPANCNLASVLADQGEFREVLACCERVEQIKKDFLPVLIAAGRAHLGLNEIDAALAKLRHATSIAPDTIAALGALGTTLATAGRFQEAVDTFWRVVQLQPHHYNIFIPALFNQHYVAERTPAQNLAYAKEYGSVLLGGVTPYLHAAQPELKRRLRIGFVSGDLRRHPVGFFLENVLGHLDSDRLALYAYYLSGTTDELSERLRPRFCAWRELLGKTPADAAKIIHDDGIDILIDLSGHTTNSGLPAFAWKPAPIQAMWLGYFASTGVPTMDYVIGDRYVLPEDEADHFVETPWRLPNGYLCFQAPESEVEITAPPCTEPDAGITFGCFNNLSKMNDAVVAVWARLLASEPRARLFLKAGEFDIDYHRRTTLERFAAHGIDADRLILEGRSARDDYLACYNRVDVALDPFPYNGGTTTVETLWMGVPVVVLRGDRFVAHMGEGILHHLGHPEWIADGADDYIARARSLAGQPALLADLRKTLRDRLLASPLCDGPGFARQLEEAFAQMWQRHCERAAASPAARIDALLETAVTLQRADRPEDALAAYREILVLQPNHVDANVNAGVLAIQQQRISACVPFFKTAVEAAPDRDDLWSIYIDALLLNGYRDAAVQTLEQGRRLGRTLPTPTALAAAQAQAHGPGEQLAAEFAATFAALSGQGHAAQRLSLARQMTELLPEHGLGWKVLGLALHEQGCLSEALPALRTAAQRLPGDAEIASAVSTLSAMHQARQLANTLRRKGDLRSSRQIVNQLREAGWRDLETAAAA